MPTPSSGPNYYPLIPLLTALALLNPTALESLNTALTFIALLAARTP